MISGSEMILFAYLSNSDSVNVTSIYEMYPIGFFSIKQRLYEHGFKAEIVNLASLMLMHPQLDVEKLLAEQSKRLCLALTCIGWHNVTVLLNWQRN